MDVDGGLLLEHLVGARLGDTGKGRVAEEPLASRRRGVKRRGNATTKKYGAHRMSPFISFPIAQNRNDNNPTVN